MSTSGDFYQYDSDAYKKARRNYCKSTKHRPSDISSSWTAFRRAEKRYKAKFPPPDLSNVLDFASLPSADDNNDGCPWRRNSTAPIVNPIRLRFANYNSKERRQAFTFPRIPGLILLPGYLSEEKQRELVRWSLRDHARSPNETNLDTHYALPCEGIWNRYIRDVTSQMDSEHIQPRTLSKVDDTRSPIETPGPRQLICNTAVDPSNFHDLCAEPKPPALPSSTVAAATASELLPKLRWANIGWNYHWGSKQYDFSRGRVETAEIVSRLCKEIVGSIDWQEVFGDDNDPMASYDQTEESGHDWGSDGPDWNTWDTTYEPDAGIVNFYQLKDTLMGHVDRSEVCATSPLVSLSLGNAGIFLIGGLTRDVEPMPILLRSGDVVIMAGPKCRRAYHGVPRILEGTLPSHLQHVNDGDEEWKLFAQYLQTTRINVNVRQVFPKDFRPDMASPKQTQ